MLCFECDNQADHQHHVVPRVLGGSKTVPLCGTCHGKVHDLALTHHRALIKNGMEKAKERLKAEGRSWGRLPVEVSHPGKVEQAERLRKEGKSIHAIAREVELSSRTVWRILQTEKNLTVKAS